MTRTRMLGAPIAAAALLFVALLVAIGVPYLVPTLGVVVVGAGLLLGPRATLVLGLCAVSLAVLLVTVMDHGSAGPYRVVNVTLLSILAFGIAVALERRLAAMERMRAAESAVLASVPDGIVVVDPSGTIVQLNGAMGSLVPGAGLGVGLHGVLGHVLGDGEPCPGGCALDRPGPPVGPVEGEWIAPRGTLIPVEYTTGRVGDRDMVVCLRDATAMAAADEDRRILLGAAAREREQSALVAEAFGSTQRVALPQHPGVELDLWRTSPGRANVSGCDLAEAAPLPGGQLLVIVVDACGEGMVAARDAWKVLFVVRSFLAAGVPLEEVIDRATVALAGEVHPPASSLVAALVDSSTGVVRVVGAGHPPPLLVRVDGSSDWLGVGGPGIGDLPARGSDGRDAAAPDGAEPGAARPVVTTTLHPGDTLVLYSDGVVDGDRELVDAMTLLQSASTARRRVAMTGWAKGLLSTVHAGLPAQSDATVLALRRTGEDPRAQTA